MPTITVRQHADFWDREKRIVFGAEIVRNEDGARVMRAVARDVPDDVAREYAERPEQFIVEGLSEAPGDPLDGRGLNARDTIALFEALTSVEGVARARAAEEAREGGPRKTVVTALDARAAELRGDAPGDGAQS